MKAMTYTQYGSPDVLTLNEVEKPTPDDNQILIKVRGSSINFADTAFLSGKSLIMRLGYSGLFKPKVPVLGADVSGIVEAVGQNVTHVKVGDEVYGELGGFGSFAEYAVAPANEIALKPSTLSFEEAATVPQSGVVALQGLRDHGKIKAGDKVLINGASGTIGSFAIQLAKVFGAEVTAVCSTSKVDFVKSLGADHVIDYKKQDIVKGTQKYDLILDIAIQRPITDYKRILTDNGICAVAGGSIPRILQTMILGPIASRFISQTLMGYEVKQTTEDLDFMRDLIDAGKIRPAIDGCFPLEKLPDAFKLHNASHRKGKVAISVASST